VANFGFDFVDARDIYASALAQFRGGLARHHACFSEGFARGQLDFQPLLKAILFAPDAAHFRAGVTCDQNWLLRHSLVRENQQRTKGHVKSKQTARGLPSTIIPEIQRTREACGRAALVDHKPHHFMGLAELDRPNDLLHSTPNSIGGAQQ